MSTNAIGQLKDAKDLMAQSIESLEHELQTAHETIESLRLENIRLKRAATLATSKTDDTGQWDQVETVRFVYLVSEFVEYAGEAVVSIRKAVAQQDEFGVPFDDGEVQVEIEKCFKVCYEEEAQGYMWDLVNPYHKDFDLAVLRKLERAAIENVGRNTDHITFPGEERV